MAGSVSSGGTSRRRGRASSLRPQSDINITPLVDVMLVLLIIFMVTAPLLTPGVPVDLPRAKARQLNDADKEPLTITIDRQGRIFLQETEIGMAELVPRLTAIARNGYDQRILVRGDTAVDYGSVMRVMGELNVAGFRRIGLVTGQQSAPDKKQP
jgi:biopolymer transport protein TolR